MTHYYSEKQTSPLHLKQIQVRVGGNSYSFYTGSGVFSKSKLDFGTKVMIKYMDIKEEEDVLDLGCGIGIIGRIVSERTKGEVVLTDINTRAVTLAEMNTKNLKNIKVYQGDMYEPVSEKKFDVILLNPPQTAGKKVCMEMIKGAMNYLKPEGNLQVVARHNKGGETLSKYMKDVFGNMDTLGKQGGYRVYKSVLNK